MESEVQFLTILRAELRACCYYSVTTGHKTEKSTF